MEDWKTETYTIGKSKDLQGCKEDVVWINYGLF